LLGLGQPGNPGNVGLIPMSEGTTAKMGNVK
jgi:hypothetical protein